MAKSTSGRAAAGRAGSRKKAPPKGPRRRKAARRAPRKAAPRSAARKKQSAARKKTPRPVRKRTRRRKPAEARAAGGGRRRAVARRPSASRKASSATRRAKAAPAPRPAAARKKPARKPASAKVRVKLRAKAAAKAASARPVARPPAPVAVRAPRRRLRALLKRPALDRERRRLPEADLLSTPSSLDFNEDASAARSGQLETLEHLAAHTESGPKLTGGDIDADWESAYATGDESPGGDNPTPDQDIVDQIGRSLGLEDEDNEELKGADKIEDRDRHRWELDPASSEDFKQR